MLLEPALGSQGWCHPAGARHSHRGFGDPCLTRSPRVLQAVQRPLEKGERRAGRREDPGAAPTQEAPVLARLQGKPPPVPRPRRPPPEGGRQRSAPPPGRAQCVAAAPPAWSRSFQAARAAGRTDGHPSSPPTPAMRPLLLLAPLGWLLLARAKGDAKPEGEGARAGRGQGERGGRGLGADLGGLPG